MAININPDQKTDVNTPAPQTQPTPASVQDKEEILTNEGLSQEEKKDPNRIRITISDRNAPLIMLFGPAGCGKTMTMVRLSRFLHSQGYQLVPDRVFRPSYDKIYKEICDQFPTIVNSDDAAKSTDHISFMLLKVIKNGDTVCQILEGPGELYFDPSRAEQDWPTYVLTLLHDSSLRKIIVPFVEPSWEDDQTRRNYVSTINQLKMSTDNQKFIFLYNKIDKTPFVRQQGVVNNKAAFHQVKGEYPGIFSNFVNNNPITRLWREYNFDFVPFQTGSFVSTADGDRAFVEGSDKYPSQLWSSLLKAIRG